MKKPFYITLPNSIRTLKVDIVIIVLIDLGLLYLLSQQGFHLETLSATNETFTSHHLFVGKNPQDGLVGSILHMKVKGGLGLRVNLDKYEVKGE